MRFLEYPVPIAVVGGTLAGLIASKALDPGRRHPRAEDLVHPGPRRALRIDSIASLEGVGVHVLSRREIENFLLEPGAIAQVLVGRRRDVGSPLEEDASPEDVGQQLSALADELRPQVVLKRVAQEIVPIRLLDREEVANLAASNPTLPALLAVVSRNLPTADVTDKITETWRTTEASVTANWAASWKLLVPGSDIFALSSALGSPRSSP